MIEELIPKGYANRVTREYLHRVTGMSDRKVRKEIELAAGRCLIVSCDGGYFQRKDENDDPYIREYYEKEWARFKTQRKKLDQMRKALNIIHPKPDRNQFPGQMSLFEE